MKKLVTFNISVGLFTAFAAVAWSTQVLADCAGPTLHDVQGAYRRAQEYDNAGQSQPALQNYRSAEASICEGNNPYADNAAQRAAALGRQLGSAAEQRKDWQAAFDAYDAGGHFADADRVYMIRLRAHSDDASAYEAARELFGNRALPAFQSNNAPALRATGAYRLSPALVAEMAAMPAKGVASLIQKEQKDFSEQYLRDYLQLIQSRPTNPLDVGAMQRFTQAGQAFSAKWPNDPLKASQETLRGLRAWTFVVQDAALKRSIQSRYAAIVEQRVATLTQHYAGAPALLDAAQDYTHMLELDDATIAARIAKIRGQADRLGSEADAANRYTLAAEYYDIADEGDKADAARERMNQTATQAMQPSIQDMQRQAEQLRAQFDPEKVKAMQEQAQAMQRALQQQQSANKQAGKKSAAELEKELGL